MRRPATWRAFAVLAMLAAFALTACASQPPDGGTPTPDEAVTVGAAAGELTWASDRHPAPAHPAVPTRLRIASIGVDTPLESLDRDESGVLQPPIEWQQAGWYVGGPVPGDRGPAVVAGHVDSPDGPAVFARLSELVPGDRVVVERDDGTAVTFEVDGASTFAQDDFPTAAVYGPVPDRQLRLITCHTYDDRHNRYVDNLVVFATAV